MSKVEGIRGWSVNRDKEAALPAVDRLSLLEEANGNRLDIPTVEEFLKLSLPAEGGATREQVRDVLEAVGRPDHLLKLTTSLLSDQEQLRSLEAYGHTLGMDRIQIATFQGFTLRLHFWEGMNELEELQQECIEDPHLHEYDFGSKVEKGRVITHLFVPDSDGVPMNQFAIASQVGKQKPIPKFVGEARLQTLTPPEGIILTDRDPSYTMSHKAFHSLSRPVDDGPIITLNLRGAPVLESTTFFRNNTMPKPSLDPKDVDVEKRVSSLNRHLLLAA